MRPVVLLKHRLLDDLNQFIVLIFNYLLSVAEISVADEYLRAPVNLSVLEV